MISLPGQTHMMRRRGLALLVMATIGAWPPAGVLAQAAAASAAPVLTLDAAIDAALAHNRQVQSGALDVSKADESTAAIKATRFPKITANLLAGVSLTPITFTIPAGTLGTYQGLGPLPATDSPITTPRQLVGFFQASVAQPLSQLFKINLALEESDVSRQLANEQLRTARQDTVLQVKHAYADLSQLQNQIESAEAAVASLTELSALTDRRLAEEAVLKADDLSVKARLSQQRYQLLALRDALDSGRESFNGCSAAISASDFRSTDCRCRHAKSSDSSRPKRRRSPTAPSCKPRVRRPRSSTSRRGERKQSTFPTSVCSCRTCPSPT